MKKILFVLIPVIIVISIIIIVPKILTKKSTTEVLNIEESDETKHGIITAGSSLYNVLKAENLSESEIALFCNNLKDLCKLEKYKVGDSYELIYTKNGKLKAFKYILNDSSYEYTLTYDKNGNISVASQKVFYKEKIVGVSGGIKTSLWNSMIENGLSPALIMDYTDIFSWQIDFLTEPRVGDKYKMVCLRKYSDKGQYKDEKILSAQYLGKETGQYTAIGFKDGYYEPNRKSLRKQFLKAPLNFRRISSYFTHKRFHPILRYYRPHLGIDYAAPKGTPVVSIGDGIVISCGWKGDFGKAVIIKHNSIYTTHYGHLSSFAKGIRKGVKVKQGQLIAYVGSTGLSTGPHLHFNFIKNGKHENFIKLNMPAGSSVYKQDIVEFDKLKKEYLMKIAKIRDKLIIY